MPAPAEPTLTKETLQRMATEEVHLTLTDREAEALLEVVNDLLHEAEEAVKLSRGDADPVVEFSLEPWTND